MRVIVLAHQQDIPDLAWAFEDNNLTLSPQIFENETHAFELIVFGRQAGNSIFQTAEGQETRMVDISEQCSTIVLLGASHAFASRPLLESLRTFLHGEATPIWRNQALVVLHRSTIPPTLEDSLPSERVFVVPDDHESQGVLDLGIQPGHEFELAAILDAIAENQTQNPNVGFGLLLLDPEGKFFLMERLREPGRRKFGTLGGNFLRGQSMDTQLDELLRRRFRSQSRPRIRLGPLLACTSMRNDFYHYIDLTFLANTQRKVALSGVSDPQLRPLPQEAVEQASGATAIPGDYPRYTFTLEEMIWFHNANMLFRPVANAFEACVAER